MSEREMRRAAVLAQVKRGAWTLVQAAERRELCYRQAKRLWKRYQSKGAAGLVHGSAGGSSNRAKPKKISRKVLGLLRQKYSGEVGERFGPTLAAEHLASEDQIDIIGHHRTPLDAGRGTMEPRQKSAPAPAKKSTAGALRRTGAVGRKLP